MRSWLIVALVVLVHEATATTVNSLGQFTFKNAGFVTLLPNIIDSSHYDVFLSAFAATASEVAVAYNVSTAAVSNTIPVSLPKSSIDWPNEIDDAGKFLDTPGVFVSSGFLAPGHTTGGVYFVNNTGTTPAPVLKISTDKTDYFYHRSLPVDLLSTGNIGVLTCRAKQPTIGKADAEMVYITRSGSTFTEHVIASGIQTCDTFFRVIDLDNDGYMEIIAGVFFGNALTLFWADKGAYLTPSSVHSKIVDGNCGGPFDLTVVDLNGDGLLDVLMSDAEEKKPGGNVYAYEIPTNFRTDAWTRHTLASGFTQGNPLPGHMAPGAARSLLLKGSKKPVIFLSGDDGGNLYVITANKDGDVSDWTYTTGTVSTISGTVGGMDIADVDKDGYSEIYLAAYSNGYMQVLRVLG